MVSRNFRSWPRVGFSTPDNAQVDVFGHAPDEAMRAAERRTATEHEPERRGVGGGGDSGERLDDVPVLLDQRRARQAEVVLDFEEVLETRLYRSRTSSALP